MVSRSKPHMPEEDGRRVSSRGARASQSSPVIAQTAYVAALTALTTSFFTSLTSVWRDKKRPEVPAGIGGATRAASRALLSVCLGTRPARKHEGDLVDKVRNVVDHIEGGFIHRSEEVAKQVARGINGPANRDDEAHVVERPM